MLDRVEHLQPRQRSAVASSGRNDAEGAAVAAAILNFQGWPSTVCSGGFGQAPDRRGWQRRQFEVTVPEDIS
ncbi:MAG: hypothetical protein V4587_10305, partial [Acidobacteriota bacterium]